MFKKLVADFPILSRVEHGYSLAYLDNASTTQKPTIMLNAVTDFYTNYNANVSRGLHGVGEQATLAYQNARKDIATFLNAEFSEIIFTSGTTCSINLIAYSWALKKLTASDEILVSELEHHANLLPWQRVAEITGARLLYIPITVEGDLNYLAYESLISKNTKLVCITSCSNVLGTSIDLERIINTAHSFGAHVLVDAAQTAAHEKINVKKLSPDFLVFSGHKVVGPTGIGVLYISKELHDQLQPYQLGGGMVQSVEWYHVDYGMMPYLLEAGTPPIAQAIGLAAACNYVAATIFIKNLAEYEASLMNILIDGLQSIKGVRILGPQSMLRTKGHILSFIVDNFHAHDVAAYLDQFGIAVRAGNHCAQPLVKKLGVNATVRVSLYAYNSAQDIVRVIDAVKKLVLL